MPWWIPGIRMLCYPVHGEKNELLYHKYLEMAEEYTNIIFCGRLGSYKANTMAETMSEARKLAIEIS